MTPAKQTLLPFYKPDTFVIMQITSQEMGNFNLKFRRFLDVISELLWFLPETRPKNSECFLETAGCMVINAISSVC